MYSKGYVIKPYDWNKEKNKILKMSRKVCFEDVVLSIETGELLDVLPHFNLSKYPNQKLFIVSIHQYTYYVPFVEDEEKVFLKNIIPSRKYHKKYKRS